MPYVILICNFRAHPVGSVKGIQLRSNVFEVCVYVPDRKEKEKAECNHV